jgi:hypothetical protein
VGHRLPRALIVKRRQTFPLPGSSPYNLGRDTLEQLLGTILKNLEIGVAMPVNESGSNHETRAVHRFGVRYNRDLSHCFDRVAANQEIA